MENLSGMLPLGVIDVSVILALPIVIQRASYDVVPVAVLQPLVVLLNQEGDQATNDFRKMRPH